MGVKIDKLLEWLALVSPKLSISSPAGHIIFVFEVFQFLLLFLVFLALDFHEMYLALLASWREQEFHSHLRSDAYVLAACLFLSFIVISIQALLEKRTSAKRIKELQDSPTRIALKEGEDPQAIGNSPAEELEPAKPAKRKRFLDFLD